MSKNQARKETSVEAFTRIALENKAKSDAKKIQQSLDREERIANRNTYLSSNQTGTNMTEEALKAEILQLKSKVETQNVDLTKFGQMQTHYFENIKELEDVKKEDKEHARAMIVAQKELAQINLETARLGLETSKVKQDNRTAGISSGDSYKRNRLGVSQPFFSGKQSDALSVRNWILTTEVNLKASKIGDEFQAYEAGGFLRENANAVFLGLVLIKNDDLTWKELKEALLKAFEPVNIKSLVLNQLMDCRQVECPTLAEYIEKFRGLAILVDLSEQSKVDIFVRNLKDEVKLCITSAIPNTLVEVISKVLEIDTNLILCKRNTNNGFPGINYFGNQKGNDNKNGHNNNHNTRKDSNSSDKWCEFHQNSSHNSVDCRTRKNRDCDSKQNKSDKDKNENDSDSNFCKFCDSYTCHKKSCFKLQKKVALSRSKGVPNPSNVRFDYFEEDIAYRNKTDSNNNMNNANINFSASNINSNYLGALEFNKNILDNIKSRHEHLALTDTGDIMVDFGSINGEPVEIIFDSGCFKSVIPLSYVEKLKLDITPYNNCGFVANQEKIIISGATIRTPFDYKHTSTNMSFLILPRNNILLGMDWLTFNKAIIGFGDRSISFGGKLNKTYYIEGALQLEYGKNLNVVFGMNALEIFKLDVENTIQDSRDNDGKISFDEQDRQKMVLNTHKEALLQVLPDVKSNIEDNRVLNSLMSVDLIEKEVDSNNLVTTKLKVCSSPCEREFKEMVTRQLSLLDRSVKSLDPWEDNNLLEFIQTGRHSNGISKKQIKRIELLARDYIFSDNILLYKNKQVLGKDITFKIVPPIVKREDIVRHAHNLGHFATEKTLSQVRKSFFWPHMYKDVDCVLRNCINCLKNQKFREKDHPDIGLRKLEFVPNSVTEMDEIAITNYDISRIISGRGHEPNIEFLVEWKDKPKEKNTWILELDLKKCPDQINTNSIISAFKANIKLRMGTRLTSGLNYLNIMIICLFFLPLVLGDNLPGEFTFCSFNKESPILKFDTDCHTGVINPIYENKNFTLLEKRQFMISGVMFACWAEKITRTSRRILFLFPEEERLKPERILLSVEDCWNMINKRTLFGQKLSCDNESKCISYIEPKITFFPHVGMNFVSAYHLITTKMLLNRQFINKPIFEDSITSCLPNDLFCVHGTSSYVWNSSIIHVCEYVKIKSLYMRGNNQIFFNKNSLIQIEHSFKACGIKIYTSTEGLFLSEDMLAEKLEIGVEDINLEHDLTISDFDKKILDVFEYISKVSGNNNLKFCSNKKNELRLIQQKVNQFSIVSDSKGNQVIIYNLEGDIIRVSCFKFSKVKLDNSIKECFDKIPVIGNKNGTDVKVFLHEHNIVSNFAHKASCDNKINLKLDGIFKLFYTKGITKIIQSRRKIEEFHLIDQGENKINFDHDDDVIFVINPSSNFIEEKSDKLFYIAPGIKYINSSSTNIEGILSYMSTIKWNPFSWDFFKDLGHLIKTMVFILVIGSLIVILVGILFIIFKGSKYGYKKYKKFKKNKKLNQEEVELSVISPLVKDEPMTSTMVIESETSLHLEPFLPIKYESQLHSEIICPELRRRSMEVSKNLEAYKKVIQQNELEKKIIFKSQAFKDSLIKD